MGRGKERIRHRVLGRVSRVVKYFVMENKNSILDIPQILFVFFILFQQNMELYYILIQFSVKLKTTYFYSDFCV